jgi:hypothetical protein
MTDMEDLWVIGELHGPFRGQMAKLARDWQSKLEFVQVLASVGSSGWWPHCVAFWRASPAQWVAQLDRGLADDFDEGQVWWGEARVCRLVRGALPPAARAFLIERVVASDGLDGLDGPDAVFAEVFAPRNGYAIWGAADFLELGRYEEQGIGSAGQVAERMAWWATVPPQREMV